MTLQDRLQAYIGKLFAVEDEILQEIRREHRAAGLPEIAISAEEGKLLQVLLHAVQARRVLEIGTLGGYSGVWLARALGPGGKLTTIEINPNFARLARRTFEKAGVSQRVEVLEGKALDILPLLRPGFDAVFVDADKEPLAEYYRASLQLLRVGGLLLCDNAFFDGRVVDAADRRADIEGVRAFNRLASTDPRLVATVVPVRDGLLVGVKVGE